MKPRFFLPVLSALLFCLILSSIIFYVSTVKIVISQTLNRSHDTIAVVSDALKYSELTVQQTVLNIAELIPSHIVVVDENSLLIADSHKTGSVSGQFINSVLSEARTKPFAYSTVRHSDKELLVSAARKQTFRDDTVFILVTFQIDDVTGFTYVFLVWFLSMALLFSLLLWLISSYFLKQYRYPIRNLLQHTRDIRGSGFTRISVGTGNNELSLLVRNFNALITRYNLLVDNNNNKYSRINTLLANLKNGILMVDRSNQIKLVNPRAELLLDIDKSKLFMNEQSAFFHNELIEKVMAETHIVNRVMQNRQLTFTTDAGLILDISIEAVNNKYKPYEHSGALVIITDVTELRHLERLKDEFVANVSHELRTPLTVISGFVETLKEWEILEVDDRHTALDIIYLETERLKKLISELLLLSRIDGGMKTAEKAIFDPVVVIREVIDSLCIKSSEKDLLVSTSYSGPGFTLSGVEAWFRQIVYNIYGNAIKFTPPGGQIDIYSSCKDGFFHLNISDSGPGIPESDREKIFQRFFQLNESVNRKNTGSGLGLSIARHMVEEFDGIISVSDNSCGGVLFSVVIPGPQKEIK